MLVLKLHHSGFSVAARVFAGAGGGDLERLQLPAQGTPAVLGGLLSQSRSGGVQLRNNLYAAL
jgi:hypothetical protein